MILINLFIISDLNLMSFNPFVKIFKKFSKKLKIIMSLMGNNNI